MAGAQQVGQRGRAHARRGDRLVRDPGVARPDLEAERQRPRRDRRADPPEPDDAEPGAADAPERARALRVPVAVADAAVELDHAAHQREGERERAVGHLLDAVVGHVADPHAAVAARRVEVDVVEADARGEHDAQAGQPGELGLPHPPLPGDDADDVVAGRHAVERRDGDARAGERGGERLVVDRGVGEDPSRGRQEAGAVTLPRATSMLGVFASSLRV